MSIVNQGKATQKIKKPNQKKMHIWVCICMGLSMCIWIYELGICVVYTMCGVNDCPPYQVTRIMGKSATLSCIYHKHWAWWLFTHLMEGWVPRFSLPAAGYNSALISCCQGEVLEYICWEWEKGAPSMKLWGSLNTFCITPFRFCCLGRSTYTAK